MQKHTRIYLNYFGHKIPEDVRCEICHFKAVDIHHINGRGKGKDVIENLAALCRNHHNDCHNEKIKKPEMQTIHNKFLMTYL